MPNHAQSKAVDVASRSKSGRAAARSLRSTLTGATVLVAAIALVVATTLFALTSLLHVTTRNAGSAVETIRLAQEAEIALLLHARVSDPVLRRNIAGDLRQELLQAKPFVATNGEAKALARAGELIEAYLASPEAERSARHADAFDALEALVEVNVAQARSELGDAEQWDRRANWVGLVAVALLVLLATTFVLWLRRRAFAPVLSLASVMERFGRGERDVRAREYGAAEIREMSRTFNAMAATLAAQRRAQVAFLGGVAHDLRNPLSVLKLSAATIRPNRPLPPEPEIRKLVERLERQITRFDRMLGDLLDMTRFEAGTVDLQIGEHDARALVSNVVELFESTAEHPLVVSLPAAPIPLECDPVRFEQIVTNLVSNAIKYSPPESAIEIELYASGEECMLRVTDHGVGIPYDDQATVFEPFRRVGFSRDSVPGAGLGLFVVQKIVLAHGGRIDLDSAVGQGSTFRVVLPRTHEQGLASRGRPSGMHRAQLGA